MILIILFLNVKTTVLSQVIYEKIEVKKNDFTGALATEVDTLPFNFKFIPETGVSLSFPNKCLKGYLGGNLNYAHWTVQISTLMNVENYNNIKYEVGGRSAVRYSIYKKWFVESAYALSVPLLPLTSSDRKVETSKLSHIYSGAIGYNINIFQKYLFHVKIEGGIEKQHPFINVGMGFPLVLSDRKIDKLKRESEVKMEEVKAKGKGKLKQVLTFKDRLEYLSDNKSQPLISLFKLVTQSIDTEQVFSIPQGDSMKIQYAPAVKLPLSKSLTFGIGPKILGVYDSLQTAFDLGGRFFLRYKPINKKWLPYLQAEYGGLIQTVSRQYVDKWKIESLNWKADYLLGIGYSFRVTSSNNIEMSLFRKLRMNKGDFESTSEPWDFRFSFSTDMPYIDKEINRVELPKPDFDLSQFLKLGGELNISIQEPIGVELAPNISYRFGKQNKQKVKPWVLSMMPLLSFSRVKEYGDLVSYGGRLQGMYNPSQFWPSLQLEVESINASDYRIEEYKRVWCSSIYFGAKHQFSIGGLFSYSINIMRNLTYQESTPVNSSPWVVRIGFGK
ncbi:hypothetical protein GCM10023331_26360 [Algivirga pacifica]|uniref:DUF5723 domain-containing protein n=1 Tax=Algivirga pacifica TaxID=1162670 RepID=A0ABP9DDX6_9BACT